MRKIKQKKITHTMSTCMYSIMDTDVKISGAIEKREKPIA